MKKHLSLLLVLLLSVLTGCGGAGSGAPSMAARTPVPSILLETAAPSPTPTPAPAPSPTPTPTPTPSPTPTPTPTPSPSPTPDPMSRMTGENPDCLVSITGAEEFSTGSGEAGVRFYYDFTNRSDGPLSSRDVLIPQARQGQTSLEPAWAMEDVPEAENWALSILPGVTLCCTAEYAFDPEAGAIEFCLEHPVTGRQVLADYDPEKLPGPPKAAKAAAFTLPENLSELPKSCETAEGCTLTIHSVSATTDWLDRPMAAVQLVFRNGSESACEPLSGLTVTVMQDGISLVETFPLSEDETEEADGPAEPGEVREIARYYLLRSTSPVTVTAWDSRGEALAGTVGPVG